MKYANGNAFRAALDARLRQAAPGGEDLARHRRAIAFDRLLARLAVADHDSWMLKGGAALEFRLADRARATKDIDLALFESSDPVDVLLGDLEHDAFGDYFEFSVTRRKDLQPHDDRGPVVRLSVEARLGGRAYEKFTIDIVTPLASHEASDLIELGNRLSFADLPIVTLPVIDLNTHWAEKFSAYVRRYHERPNTRVKDLVDLVLLIDHGLQSDSNLRLAIEKTFDARTQELPGDEVPSMATEWAEPFALMAAELRVSTPDAFAAHDLVQDFWNRCKRTN